MKKCSNCGKEILEKAVCCPYCGAQQNIVRVRSYMNARN